MALELHHCNTTKPVTPRPMRTGLCCRVGKPSQEVWRQHLLQGTAAKPIPVLSGAEMETSEEED